MTDIYRLTLPTLEGTLAVSKGVVVSTSPNLRRFWGRLFSNVQEWVNMQGYKLEPVPPEEHHAEHS